MKRSLNSIETFISDSRACVCIHVRVPFMWLYRNGMCTLMHKWNSHKKFISYIIFGKSHKTCILFIRNTIFIMPAKIQTKWIRFFFLHPVRRPSNIDYFILCLAGNYHFMRVAFLYFLCCFFFLLLFILVLIQPADSRTIPKLLWFIR